MNRLTLKKVLQYILFTSLAAFMFWLAARNVSYNQLVNEIKEADIKYILLSVAFGFIGYLARAFRWKILIEPLQYSPRVINTFSTLMIGYLANFMFPRIGEVTRCGMLSKKENIPFDKLVGTVILERAFDLLILILLLIFLFIANYSLFGKFIASSFTVFIKSNYHAFIIPGIAVILLLLVFMFVLIPFFRRNKIRFLKIRQVRKFYRGMKGTVTGVKTILRLRKSHWFIFNTLIIWVSYWLMTYFMLFALKATSALSAIDGVFLMVMGGIGMSLPVQGGIGAFHAIITLSLALYGINEVHAFAFATLLHEAHAIFGIALGLLSLILFYISKGKLLVKRI